jgi:hypothetical protein
MGLVSTIKPDPPELNWIFVDRDTQELRYGNKTASINHIYGPWDWSADQKLLSLNSWDEGFLAVEEEKGVWVVHYDAYDDFMDEIADGRRVVGIDLVRRVLKLPGQ